MIYYYFTSEQVHRDVPYGRKVRQHNTCTAIPLSYHLAAESSSLQPDAQNVDLRASNWGMIRGYHQPMHAAC